MIGTLEGFRDYTATRGNTAPTDAEDSAATAALVRASDHIQFGYVDRFAVGFDALSPNVEAATYEAAALELEKPNFFSRTYTPGERKVLTEVNGIKWEVIGGENAGSAAPRSTRIEDMLKSYMSAGLTVFIV